MAIFTISTTSTDLNIDQAFTLSLFMTGTIGGGGVTSVNSQTGVVILNQDNITDGLSFKQYSQIEKLKLALISAGATANDTDTNLKNRANHTGIEEIITDVQALTPAGLNLKTSTGVVVATLGAGNTANVTLFGNTSMNNANKIINHIDPTQPQDVATKNYIDSRLTPKLFYQTKLMEFGMGYGTAQTAGANTIYYQLVEIDRPTVVFGARVLHTGIISGNLQVAFYKISSLNRNNKAITIDNSTKIAESLSTVQANFNQPVDFITPILIDPGFYFLAVQYSSATAQFQRHSNFTIYTVAFTATSGGFVLPATVPAGAIATNNNQPVMLLIGNTSYV